MVDPDKRGACGPLAAANQSTVCPGGTVTERVGTGDPSQIDGLVLLVGGAGWGLAFTVAVAVLEASQYLLLMVTV